MDTGSHIHAPAEKENKVLQLFDWPGRMLGVRRKTGISGGLHR
jgi:hypothetical protein